MTFGISDKIRKRTAWPFKIHNCFILSQFVTNYLSRSVGCIFAELLSMQRSSVAHYAHRRPLFPGRSCFPLSAESSNTYQDRRDQLNVIFGVIGTPSTKTWTTCEKRRLRYLESSNKILLSWIFLRQTMEYCYLSAGHDLLTLGKS